MNCQESMRLLPGYFDSELDLVHVLEIEDHLRTCAACTSALEADRALRTTIARGNLRFSMPPNVARNVRAEIANSFPQEKSARNSWSWNWAFAATRRSANFLCRPHVETLAWERAE